MSSLSTAVLRLHTQTARNSVPLPSSDALTYDSSDYGVTNRMVTRQMYEQAVRRVRESIYEDQLTSATSEAAETFMNLLSDRMDEYNQLQNDWIPQLLTEFGKNFPRQSVEEMRRLRPFLSPSGKRL